MDDPTKKQITEQYCNENDMTPDAEIWQLIDEGWGDSYDNVSTSDNYLPQILKVMLDIRQLLILNEIRKVD